MDSFRSIALTIAAPLLLSAARIATTDACTLLTPAEVNTVLGEKILPGQLSIPAAEDLEKTLAADALKRI